MSTLISILQAQHRAIETRAKSIQFALDAADSGRIVLELPVFRAALTSHLRFEDAELYPGIAQNAHELRDLHLVSVAQTFTQSMKQITEGLSALLARHERRNLDLATFSRDWASLTAVLASRIRSEEQTLYGLYESSRARLDAQAAASGR